MEFFRKLFSDTNPRWLTMEFFRTVPMIVLAVFLLWGDPATLGIVRYVVGFLILIALLTHTLRKVLFPYVDLREFVSSAKATPLGAGLVFLGFSLIICTIIMTAAAFFK